jgi:hypothetical protein
VNPLAGKVFSAEKILPSNTYLLLMLPDMKSAIEQYKKSTVSEILNHASMKEPLSRFFSALEELRIKIETQYGFRFAEILSALHGQCAVAILPSAETGKTPAVVVLIDAPGQGPRVRGIVENVMVKWVVSPSWPSGAPGGEKTPPGSAGSRPPAGPSTSQLKGFDITGSALAGVPFYSTLLGDTYLLATSKKVIEDAIALQAGGTGTLAANDTYKRVRAKVGAKNEIATAFLNMEAYLADHKGAMTPAVMNMLDRAGVAKAKAVAYSASFEDAGIKERLYAESPEARSGLVALVSQPESKRQLLKLVPSSALWCASIGMEPSAFWKALRAMGMPEGATMAEFEKKNGVDIEREVCPSLGNEILVFGLPPESTGMRGGTPANVVVAVKAANPAAAVSALEKVLKGIAAVWPSPPPTEFEIQQPGAEAQKPGAPQAGKPAGKPEEAAKPPVEVPAFFSDVPYRARTIRELTPPEKSPAPKLSLVAGKDYVLLARTADLARIALDVEDGVRAALTADTSFADLLKRVPPQATGLLYLNPKVGLEIVQRLARERGMEPFKDQTITIDYSRIPLTDIVAKRMFGVVASVVNGKEGVTFEAYSIGGFLSTLEVTGMAYASSLPKPYHPKELLLDAWVTHNLAEIGAAMRKYAETHDGSLPPGGLQANELVSSGCVRNLRFFYLPGAMTEFSGFPENIDFQFAILTYSLSDNPKTPLAWDRRKDSAGGRHVLRLDGTVQWMPDKQFEEAMK